jgi:hypothetical protein
MSRILPAVLAGLTLFAAAPACAADKPVGTWKINIPGTNLTFLIALAEKDGKLTGQSLGTSIPDLTKITVNDAAVTDDVLRFTLKFQVQGSNQEWSFEGKLPPDKTGRIAGSFQPAPGQVVLIHLEPSKMKAYDRFEAARETVESATEPRRVVESATDLAKLAGEKKAKIEEVRGWADKAFKTAEAHGPRYQRTVSIKLAEVLAPQKEYAPLAVEYARKTERLVDDTDDRATQMDLLEAIVGVLAQAGKADDAKELLTRQDKLDQADLTEYSKKSPFNPGRYEGRRSKSDRAVLVELFTGAECPPCVAADLAFDGLEKTYKPSEVILLQYHVHIPGPDPLTNPDTNSRLQYYGKKVQGAPAMFIDGKAITTGGGPAAKAKAKYDEYREAIDPLLDKLADAKLQLTATKKGNEINIKATVEDIARTGESLRLRLALVEDHVRYQGGNAVRYHHSVVRALPGGARGVAVTKKGTELAATVKIDQLRDKLNDYLDEYGKDQDFPRPDRPMNLRKLRVVAFVQDDDTNEVLQAVQVEVKE